jgi:hypothetical protein
MSRLEVSMLLYLRLFVSVRDPDCRFLKLPTMQDQTTDDENADLRSMQERGTRKRIELSSRVATLVQASSPRNSRTMMQGFDLLCAGSTSFTLQVSIRVWTAVARWPPASEPAKIQFLKAASVRQGLA